MKKIRWGIAGPGIIANKFASAIKNVDSAELVAVCSKTKDKAINFAEKYGVKNVFESYDEMAASPLLDAIYISTAHPFHKSCAEIFLRAKKHVLCEKPICINKNDVLSLLECAKQNNVFLMEAMWTRFLPAILETQKIIKDGKIGEVRSVSADFCYSCPPNEDPKLYSNDLCGGSLLDVGVYGLNFASLFFGNNPVEIKATADIKDGVDCLTNVLLKYKNGSIASISSAINTEKPANAYIYGTDGYIKIPEFYGAKEIFIYKNGNEEHIIKPPIGDGFEEEIYEACNCILNLKNQSEIMPLSESVAITELMDKIREQIGLKYPYDSL